MQQDDRFAPRAVLSARRTIRADLSPFELSLLIESLEARACRAADHPEFIEMADLMFQRVAQLRELLR
jgi:hypothetical protein